jgi:hypothetical protein
MTIENIILITLYSIGFIATCKLYVKGSALQCPNLGWKRGDTFFCLFVGLTWPISIFTTFLIFSNNIKKSCKNMTLFPFKKWYDKELEKNNKV